MTVSKPKILVVFYSMYGHVFALANEIVKGVEEAGGVAVLKQVPELIPEDKWDDNIRGAKESMKHVLEADPSTDLEGIDGIIVGTPTRFGNMSAQMRNFWDQTSSTWLGGGLIGKPASVFTSTATQHGGQETTIITTLITLVHHGMVFVGLPYSYKEQMRIDEITGGSPYGASTIAGGMGERIPSNNELKLTRDLGRHHTEIAGKLME